MSDKQIATTTLVVISGVYGNATRWLARMVFQLSRLLFLDKCAALAATALSLYKLSI